MINDNEGNLTRYKYFYLSYLVEQKRFNEAKAITDDIKFINSTLLLSQGKSWIESKNFQKFGEFFSCTNHNDLIGDFYL